MKPGIPLILGSTAILGLLWFWELDHADGRRRELASLSTRQAPPAATAPNGETSLPYRAQDPAEAEEIQRLHAEIERLRANVAARRQSNARPSSEPKANQATMTEGSLAVSEWKNQGQATPTDALETSLWAAAGGDLQTLARTLYLDPQAKAKASLLFGSLPAEQRADFSNTEEFIALLMAPDIPLGQAHLNPLKGQYPANYTEVVASLSDDAHHNRTAVIGLVKTATDEWRLLVPEEAIDKYAARLTLVKTTP